MSESEDVQDETPEQMCTRIANQIFTQRIKKIVPYDINDIMDMSSKNRQDIKDFKEWQNNLEELQNLKLENPKTSILDTIIKYTIDHKKLTNKFETFGQALALRYANIDDFADLNAKVMSRKEIDMMKNELKGQNNNLKSRIQDLTMNNREIETKLDQITEMQALSASLDELNLITFKMEEYAKASRVNGLEQDLKNYKLVEDAEFFEKRMKERIQDIENNLIQKQNKKDSKEQIKELGDDLGFRIDQRVRKLDYEKDRQLSKQDFDQQNENITELRRRIVILENKMRETTHQLNLKINMEELEDMRKLVSILPREEDIDRLKDRLYSSILRFSKDNENFKLEFEKQNQIIRSYDETMNLKCSKISMEQLRQDALCQLNEKIESTMTHIDRERDILRTDLDRVDKFSQNLEIAMNIGIERKFQHEKLKMGIKNQNTDSLATEGGQNLRKQLIMKADKIDIEKLYDIKSDKIDTNNMLSVQQKISDQFKHILVLFLELISLHQQKPNESAGSIDKRQKNLISQVKSLASWVMNFDPKTCSKNEQENLSDDGNFTSKMGGEDPDRVESVLNDYTEKLLNFHKLPGFDNRRAARSAFHSRGALKSPVSQMNLEHSMSHFSIISKDQNNNEGGQSQDPQYRRININNGLRPPKYIKSAKTTKNVTSHRQNSEGINYIIKKQGVEEAKKQFISHRKIATIKQQGRLSPTSQGIHQSQDIKLDNDYTTNRIKNSATVIGLLDDRSNVLSEQPPHISQLVKSPQNQNGMMSLTNLNFYSNGALPSQNNFQQVASAVNLQDNSNSRNILKSSQIETQTADQSNPDGNNISQQVGMLKRMRQQKR